MRTELHEFPSTLPVHTCRTSPDDVYEAKAAGIPAFKLYPAGEKYV